MSQVLDNMRSMILRTHALIMQRGRYTADLLRDLHGLMTVPEGAPDDMTPGVVIPVGRQTLRIYQGVSVDGGAMYSCFFDHPAKTIAVHVTADHLAEKLNNYLPRVT